MAGKVKIAFLGSDAIALPLLDWLAGEGSGSAEIVAVYTQPDRPAGRGQQIRPNAIKAWALAQRLPVHQPEKLTEAEREKFAHLGADLALVLAYGHILSEAFIATPRLGSLNLHASLLPRYRGASPIQTAVAAGETETGVSLMRIVRRLDAGPVADIERVPIGPLDTAEDIEGKLARACVPLIARNLPILAQGALGFVEQEDIRATYCRRLEKPDGALDFTATAAALAARINGLFPWPACTVAIADQSVRIGQADALPPDPDGLAAPGTVLGADGTGLLVATGDGVLVRRRLQRPGGRLLPAPDFLSGFSVAAGTLLPSQPMTELVSVR
jgi:methionyl-tRNA formyltransferase